jgi:hypothetical protein
MHINHESKGTGTSQLSFMMVVQDKIKIAWSFSSHMHWSIYWKLWRSSSHISFQHGDIHISHAMVTFDILQCTRKT